MSILKVNTINAATSGQAVAVDLQNPRSFRNLIINGAMQVAQRGTSGSGAYGYYSVDRWYNFNNGLDENPTISQADVSSSTSPYNLGFRKSFKVTNGNQTSGAGTSDQTFISTTLEAQDIANSGWNYTSTSSYITVSYWAKASVAQTYYGFVKAPDGSNYIYPYSFALSANTWTKITKTIPGNSNLQFDNNNGHGLEIGIYLFLGTDLTASSASLNTWAVYSSGTTRTPDQTSTWYTTNDSTFEITGAQLEVGEVATDFEHRSYGEDLVRCQRYFQEVSNLIAYGTASTTCNGMCQLPTPMRATPTLTAKGALVCQNSAVSSAQSSASTGSNASTSHSIYITGVPNFSGLTDKDPYTLSVPANNSNTIYCSAEL